MDYEKCEENEWESQIIKRDFSLVDTLMKFFPL